VLKNEVFMFAVTAIPEDIGQLEAVMVDYFEDKETVLPLVDCQKLSRKRYTPKNDDPVAENFFANRNIQNQKLLCPDFTEIPLFGDSFSNKYFYSEIRVKGCNNTKC
jgi:hypothetical protein